jgi:hypothetical protein
MPRLFGKRWDLDPGGWLDALADGEAKRLRERFAKEASDARRRRPKDTRTDTQRWAAEFAAATEQREQRKLQAIEWRKAPKAQA